MPTPNDPPNNPNATKAITDAITQGLKDAFQSSEVLDALRSKGTGGSGERLLSTPQSVAEALASSMSNMPGGGIPGAHDAIARAALGKGGSLEQYLDVPPGLGDWQGKINMQQMARYATNQAISRVGNVQDPGAFSSSIRPENYGELEFAPSSEMHAAMGGVKRAEYFQKKVVPAYEMGKQIYSDYVQPAYRQMQAASNLGASQLGGEVGGNLQVGPFGFRNPFNAAFDKGLGIKFHQFGQALGAGVNMQQMEQIDNTLFGLGFNFDNKRFRPMEKSLEDIVRFNPAIKPEVAGQLMEATGKYGTKDQLDQLKETIKSLGAVAKDSNTSIDELATQVGQFAQTAGGLGGLSYQSIGDAAALSQQYGSGFNPNVIINTLKNNPLANQRAMQMGFMPHQVGAMDQGQMRSAFEGSIEQYWKQLTGKSFSQTDKGFLEGEKGKKAMADLITLGKFDMSTDDLYGIIGNAKGRARADSALDLLDKTKGGELTLPIPKGRETDKERRARMSLEKHDQISRSQLDEIMRAGGIRGAEANKLADELMSDDGYMRKGWREKLSNKLNDQRTSDVGTTTVKDVEKVIKGLEDAANGARELKNVLPTNAQRNGGGKSD